MDEGLLKDPVELFRNDLPVHFEMPGDGVELLVAGVTQTCPVLRPLCLGSVQVLYEVEDGDWQWHYGLDLFPVGEIRSTVFDV
jgi:hypothetical protein